MPRGGTSPRTCSLGAVWAQLFMGGERLPWAHSHQDTAGSFQARGGGAEDQPVQEDIWDYPEPVTVSFSHLARDRTDPAHHVQNRTNQGRVLWL